MSVRTVAFCLTICALAFGLLGSTPVYSAPEFVTDVASVGPAADVFSFALILYELFGFGPPFRNEAHGLSPDILTLRMAYGDIRPHIPVDHPEYSEEHSVNHENREMNKPSNN